MEKILPIWHEIRLFLLIGVVLSLMWAWVSDLRADIHALTADVEESVRIARQVEYLLSEQGYTVVPLDPAPGYSSPLSGSNSPEP